MRVSGSLLYVVFFEILEKERQKNVPGILQVGSAQSTFIKNLIATFFLFVKIIN